MADFFARPPQSPARITIDPGSGNVMENALRAAQVGPYRLAHGAKRTVSLEPDEPKQVANLSSASQHAAFIALYLPLSQSGSLSITVSQDDTQGDSSGVPVTLRPLTGAEASFSCVLLPGEALYAQSPTPAQIIVCEVSF